MGGNPLLNEQTTSGSFNVKRRYGTWEIKHIFATKIRAWHCRWDDDVVFKNCAKGLDDKPKVRVCLSAELS